ncbi:MAG TPA: hypothetical protein VGG14_17565 [Candidatus Sulfotelmatobacter sp.]
MSASVGVLQQSGVAGAAVQEATLPIVLPDKSNGWKPDEFAREQIRGLVRRVFFAGGSSPVRQVVFCAAELHIDLAPICDKVARALARETAAQVALLGREEENEDFTTAPIPSEKRSLIKSSFNQLASNLWYVTRNLSAIGDKHVGTGVHWLTCLSELRKDFEYVVIEGPAAGVSSEAALLGQVTDGLILVLGAHSTRKATAQKIKQTLQGAQSRILGTVLSERRFPIPDSIYNRL